MSSESSATFLNQIPSMRRMVSSPAASFFAAILLVCFVIGAAYLLGPGATGGATAKIQCSGGMMITDGQGHYCQMSSGSCDSSCVSCEPTIKLVDAETFVKRCSAGR